MSSNSFNIICNFFGLKSTEELICARQNRFVASYCLVRELFTRLNIKKIGLVLLIMILFFLRLLIKC